jgi:L-lactate dehydrogenase complex protein LldF
VYSGPIGSIVTPELVGLSKAKDLPFASSLCGACREICPVRIDIPHLLLRLRRRWSERKASKSEQAAMRLWSLAMRHPRIYRTIFKMASLVTGPMSQDGWLKDLPFGLKAWTSNRDFPVVARRSFRSIWDQIEGDSR